jgi:hypothetical protein
MNKHTKILLILAGSYLVGLLFTLVELDSQVKKSFFPFFHGICYQNGVCWDGKMSLANYVYGYAETVVKCMILLDAFYSSGMKIFRVCFVLEVIDLIDYILLYNSTWFTIGTFHFEYNYLKVGIISYFIARDFYGEDT